MSENEVFESVLYAVENDPLPADGGTRISIRAVADRLCDEHGYTDSEDAGFSRELAEILGKWQGKMWTYHDTDQDGVPNRLYVPNLAIENLRERVSQ